MRGFALKLSLHSRHTAFTSVYIYLGGGKVIGGRGQIEWPYLCFMQSEKDKMGEKAVCDGSTHAQQLDQNA